MLTDKMREDRAFGRLYRAGLRSARLGAAKQRKRYRPDSWEKLKTSMAELAAQLIQPEWSGRRPLRRLKRQRRF